MTWPTPRSTSMLRLVAQPAKGDVHSLSDRTLSKRPLHSAVHPCASPCLSGSHVFRNCSSPPPDENTLLSLVWHGCPTRPPSPPLPAPSAMLPSPWCAPLPLPLLLFLLLSLLLSLLLLPSFGPPSPVNRK